MNQQEHIDAYLDIKTFFLNPEYDMFFALMTKKEDVEDYDNIVESLNHIYAIKSNIKATQIHNYDDGSVGLLFKKNRHNNIPLTI